MLVILLMFSAAFAFPVENITQGSSNGASLESTKVSFQSNDKQNYRVNVTITVEGLKARRQEDGVDLAAENGGLELASRIVNIILKEFSNIGQALAGNRGGAANANGGTTATGTTGVTSGGGTGNAPPRRRQPQG